MIHLGRDTSSRIISKGIAAGHSNNTYRGLVSAHRRAANARNFTNCDSLLIGSKCGAHTVPYIEAKNASATFEHEATTSKISDDQLFYCLSRGLSPEEAVALIVNGFVRDVLQHLPMEFMAETQKLIGISLEGSVGSRVSPVGERERGRTSRCERVRENVMLEIKNLHVNVDGREILKGLDLTLPAGEVHAIMGPNGSGKSTLAYVLAGKNDYEVTAGSITWNGQDLLAMEPVRARRRRRVPRLPISDGDSGRRHHDLPARGGERGAQGARRGRAVNSRSAQARACEG